MTVAQLRDLLELHAAHVWLFPRSRQIFWACWSCSIAFPNRRDYREHLIEVIAIHAPESGEADLTWARLAADWRTYARTLARALAEIQRERDELEEDVRNRTHV